MKTELSIDKAGRVVLPQAVRHEFHLTAGDRLNLKILPDGIFLQTPSRQAGLVTENGLLVHEGEPTGYLADVVERSRSDRDERVLGLKR